ncbi:hypothetical protein FC777_11245 [Clostridium botulinum]|nr:hypothetical protein [Clostridium botulinum]
MSKEYFSDKENGIKIANTEEITINVFNGIISVYSEFKKSMALKFPDKDDYGNLKDMNHGMFKERMLAVIPDFTVNTYGWISALEEGEDFDKYALLDFIEFCWEHINDYELGRYGLIFNEGDANRRKFADTINKIFERNGIGFRLNNKGEIERVLPIQLEVLVRNYCHTGNDDELNKLIDESIANIKKARIEDRQIAIEKLWDAFERIKTYYSSNKSTSAKELVATAAEGSFEFEELLNVEMKALKDIGNNYRIRHHETNKIKIESIKHIDYLFYRMMSMISLLTSYI